LRKARRGRITLSTLMLSFSCMRIGQQDLLLPRAGHIVFTTVAGPAGWRGRSPLWMHHRI
jgi:hypothetical protein